MNELPRAVRLMLLGRRAYYSISHSLIELLCDIVQNNIYPSIAMRDPVDRKTWPNPAMVAGDGFGRTAQYGTCANSNGTANEVHQLRPMIPCNTISLHISSISRSDDGLPHCILVIPITTSTVLHYQQLPKLL